MKIMDADALATRATMDAAFDAALTIIAAKAAKANMAALANAKANMADASANMAANDFLAAKDAAMSALFFAADALDGWAAIDYMEAARGGMYDAMVAMDDVDAAKDKRIDMAIKAAKDGKVKRVDRDDAMAAMDDAMKAIDYMDVKASNYELAM